MRKFVIASVAALMVSATLGLGAQTPATAGPPDAYIPKAGPTFNDPYGSPAQTRKVIRTVNRTIDSVPRGGKIRIASWNVRSGNVVNALLRAHRRNISVQIVMDRHNWNPLNPNVDAARLARGLRAGNAGRAPEHRSWLRQCFGSCRGTSGIAHSKFFLFDKVKGKPAKDGSKRMARWVAMYGSYNATELGATIQWNDLFTFREDANRYAFFEEVFRQMKHDKPVDQPFVTYDDGYIATSIYPYAGAGTEQDPDMAVLNTIACTGAATKSGRTRIRIVQTALHGERGLMIARKLAQMRRQGCDIKIVYAMFGTQVVGILRQAGINLTHLAYDSNEDGVYDRYVHSKTMAVHGNIGGIPNAMATWNGSANWTSVALVSDEVVGVIRDTKITKTYMQWVDHLAASRPAYWGRFAADSTQPGNDLPPLEHEAVARRAAERGVDPYALIKKEL